MPINTPPPAQPPAQPPVQYIPIHQQLQPVQQQNPWGIAYTDKNESNSNSKSENVISQSSSQTNVNNNYSNLNYLQGRYGVRIPSEWSFNANTNFTSGGEYVQSFGVSYTPQGRNKRIIQKTLDLDNLSRQAAVCSGLAKDGIMIDYSVQPMFSFCDGFYRAPAIGQTNVKQYIQVIEKQQATIQAILARIDEMQIERKELFNTPG